MTDIKDAAAPHLDQPGSREDLGRAAYEQELMEISSETASKPGCSRSSCTRSG